MNQLLISVHLPKTAGSSFGEILRAIAGKNYFEDYADKPLASGYSERKIANMALDNERARRVLAVLEKRPDQQVIIHGHFLANKYDVIFPGARSAIWFRDPVERLASHYYYWLREPDMQNDLCQKMHREKMDLKQFAAMEEMQNIYDRYLSTRRLESFDFIGLSEAFEQGMELFQKIFSISSIPEVSKIRRANPDRQNANYPLDPETRDWILKHHHKDVEIYAQARRRFENLLEKCG